jgi:hypothetical protein
MASIGVRYALLAYLAPDSRGEQNLDGAPFIHRPVAVGGVVSLLVISV